MSARPTDPALRVLHIMVNDAKVPSDVADWIMKDAAGPMAQSPGDLARFWSQATVVAGAMADVLALMNPPQDHGVVGRRIGGKIEQAWKYCFADFEGEAVQKAMPLAKDDGTDKDWEEDRKIRAHEKVASIYGGLELGPEMVPSDPLMREM